MPWPSRWPKCPDRRIQFHYRIGFPDMVEPIPDWYDVGMSTWPNPIPILWEPGDVLMAIFSFRIGDTLHYSVYRKRGEADPRLWGVITMRKELAFNPENPLEWVDQIVWRWFNALVELPRPDLWRLQLPINNVRLTNIQMTWNWVGFGSPQFMSQRWQARSYYDDPPFLPPGWNPT